MLKRPWAPVAILVAWLPSTTFAGRAEAEPPPTAAELAAARALFKEAERDEDALRWQNALEKITRVASIKLTPGVRYHQALCEEHLGQLVEALRDYKAAALQAREENAADVLRLVDKRVLDASARIPQLTVVVVPTLPNALVRLDGQPVREAVALPVDPGTHQVDAEAPGHLPSTQTITLEERASTSLEVKLEPAVPPPTTPSPAAPPARVALPARVAEPAATHDRILPILAGAGALGLVAGGIGAYLTANATQADAIQRCAQVASRDPDACTSQKNEVRAWDWVAVAAWAGAAGVGAIAVLSLTRHRDVASASPPGVVLGPGTVRFEGSF